MYAIRSYYAGYITRQIIAKAIYLDLDNAPVKEYMQPEPGTVEPDAEIPEIQEKIIENKQRVLPVITPDGAILGVITRTDLLNVLVQSPENTDQRKVNPMKDEISARTRNIERIMNERLSDYILDLLT